MKYFKLFLLAAVILVSNVILLETSNTLKNSTIEQNASLSIQTDSYFDLLSSNDSWIEYTVDSDSDILIDYLNIKLGITAPDWLQIYGILKDPAGNWIGYTVNETVESPTEQEITLSFPGDTIYASGYSGVYLLYIMITGPESSPYAESTRLMYQTNNYNYVQFEHPTGIILGFDDYGVDTDNDSLYNEIHVDFYVDISEAGMYAVGVMLNGHDPFNESEVQHVGMGMADLPSGDNQTIIAIIPTQSLYIDRMSGPYSLGFVYMMKLTIDYESKFQHFIYDYGFTQAYNYQQFDPASAFFTGAIFDSPLDTEGDSKFEGVEILVELNISEPGNYRVEMNYQIVDKTFYIDKEINYSSGLYNVSFFISDTRIYAQKLNGSIEVIQLYLINSDYETMHRLNPNYKTRNYLYTDFNSPGLLLTDRFFDTGVNTDNDSFFDQLKISVEVNVTINDTFMFDISLGEPVGKWTYNTTYLEVGIHNVSFYFSMNDHYQKELNTSFVVEHLSISVEDMGMHEEIYYAWDVYTTRIYYFTEFDRPSIVFTQNFWDYGLDLNNNSLFDVLVIDAEVEVFEADNFLFYGDIKTNSVPISYFYYTNLQEYFEPGIHTISFIFSNVAQERLNCSYHLNAVSARNSEFDLMAEVSDPYDTAFYYYTEFEHATVSVGNFEDFGYSSFNTSTFDAIIVAFDITFSQSVEDYTVEVFADTTSLSYGFGQSLHGYFPAGTTRIDFGFDPRTMDVSSWETSFEISVRVLDSNENTIYEEWNLYTTRTYSYTEFLEFSTTTTTTHSPEDTTTTTTTTDEETTPKPGLTPGYTFWFALFAIFTIPFIKKRGS